MFFLVESNLIQIDCETMIFCICKSRFWKQPVISNYG